MDAPRNPEVDAGQLRRKLKLYLFLTLLVMTCERAARCFWQASSIAFVVLAAGLFGIQDRIPVPHAAGAFCSLVLLGLLIAGARNFSLPSRDEARARLDISLPERPLAALADTQVIGAGDGASRAVWRVHLARMERAAGNIRLPRPDPRLPARDPYALRYAAIPLFATALIFGPARQPGGVAPAPGPTSSGPAWADGASAARPMADIAAAVNRFSVM